MRYCRRVAQAQSHYIRREEQQALDMMSLEVAGSKAALLVVAHMQGRGAMLVKDGSVASIAYPWSKIERVPKMETEPESFVDMLVARSWHREVTHTVSSAAVTQILRTAGHRPNVGSAET